MSNEPKSLTQTPDVFDAARRVLARTTDEDGCLLCDMTDGGTGRPRVNLRGSTRPHMAARVVWVAERGPLVQGDRLRRLCANLTCVNPAHYVLIVGGSDGA